MPPRNIDVRLSMSFDDLPDGVTIGVFNMSNAPEPLRTYLEEHILNDLIDNFNVENDHLELVNCEISILGHDINITATLRVTSTNSIAVLLPELNRRIRAICNLSSNVADFTARVEFPGNEQYLMPPSKSPINRMYRKMFGKGRKSKRKRKKVYKTKKY